MTRMGTELGKRRLESAAGVFFRLAIVALGVLAPLRSAEAQLVLWGSSSKGSTPNPSSVFTIDTAGGAATLVGSSGLGNGISGIKFDLRTGNLYGILGSACTGARLITINTTTGAGTIVGIVKGAGFDATSTVSCAGGADSLAFGPDGALYAGGWEGGTTGGKLLKIDKATGAVLAVLQTPGGANLTGLDFDPSGLLWASHGASNPGVLHTVNPATGGFLSELDLSEPVTISDLAFDADGTLFASLPDESQLATIDLTTGAVNRVCPFGSAVSKMSGLAFRPCSNPAVTDGTACNDGDACTLNDLCNA